MPFRRNDRGTWRIKRAFGHVGGIKVGSFEVPSGTKDQALANQIDKVLTKVADLGEQGAQLLCDIRDKRRTPLEVYGLFNRQEARGIKVIGNAVPLNDAWDAFVKTARRKNGTPISARTRRDYENYLKRLLEISPDATVHDLPAVLEQYRDYCVHPDRKFYATFIKVKSGCQAFARNTQADKQYSELWKAVSRIDGTPSETRKEPSALRVFEARAIIEALPDERMRRVCWALATCGFRPGEYAGQWEVLADRVRIGGTKTANAVRFVPLLSAIQPQAFSYFDGQKTITNSFQGITLSYSHLLKAVKNAAKKVIGKNFTPNDFRHCYRLWLREARIESERANKYFGHKNTSLAAHYADHEWSTFLAEDRKALIKYIKREWNAPKAKTTEIELLKFA